MYASQIVHHAKAIADHGPWLTTKVSVHRTMHPWPSSWRTTRARGPARASATRPQAAGRQRCASPRQELRGYVAPHMCAQEKSGLLSLRLWVCLHACLQTPPLRRVARLVHGRSAPALEPRARCLKQQDNEQHACAQPPGCSKLTNGSRDCAEPRSELRSVCTGARSSAKDTSTSLVGKGRSYSHASTTWQPAMSWSVNCLHPPQISHSATVQVGSASMDAFESTFSFGIVTMTFLSQ